tara:strand:- start:1051 stop:1257 length:207 start_codon:yes stop_codon:yes gene_type:complete
MTRISRHLSVLALTVCLVSPTPSWSQSRDSASAGCQFPTNPTAWINSRPFTREQLEGKCAVMVFFEEG